MIAYSRELYDTIAQFGLRRGATILDVGCGTGLASAPFAANGFPVTALDPDKPALAAASEHLDNAAFVQGGAEALPFPNERFDVVISAQTFDVLDRSRALTEAYRVLRPSGIIAVWWKQLMVQDAVKALRDEVLHAFGAQPADGLTGGFKEFYASQFQEQTLRVLPWRVTFTLEDYLADERSRAAGALGPKIDAYIAALEERLRQHGGMPNPALSLAYIQYLYMAKKL